MVTKRKQHSSPRPVKQGLGASTSSTAVSCEAKGLAYKFARFWALPSPGASRASAVRPNQ